jgi:hypothetical protein
MSEMQQLHSARSHPVGDVHQDSTVRRVLLLLSLLLLLLLLLLLNFNTWDRLLASLDQL